MAFRPEAATTAVSQIAPLNPLRLSLVVFNNGTATVFIDNDQANITGRGIPIAANEHVSLTVDEGDEPELALFAQTAAGTADLRIKEGFLRNEERKA